MSKHRPNIRKMSLIEFYNLMKITYGLTDSEIIDIIHETIYT